MIACHGCVESDERPTPKIIQAPPITWLILQPNRFTSIEAIGAKTFKTIPDNIVHQIVMILKRAFGCSHSGHKKCNISKLQQMHIWCVSVAQLNELVFINLL